MYKMNWMTNQLNIIQSYTHFFCAGEFRLDTIHGSYTSRIIKIIPESHRRYSSCQTCLWPYYWSCSWIFLFWQVSLRFTEIAWEFYRMGTLARSCKMVIKYWVHVTHKDFRLSNYSLMMFFFIYLYPGKYLI